MTFHNMLALLMSDAGFLFAAAALALTAVLFFVIVVLAFSARRSAMASQALHAEATAKLDAALDLAAEVRGLRQQVEAAVAHHETAVSSALQLHNDVCAAAKRSTAAYSDHDEHHDDDDDHHHAHARAMSDGHDDDHHEDDDDHHHTARSHSDEHHDDDDDDHHGTHHAGFFGSLFGRKRKH